MNRSTDWNEYYRKTFPTARFTRAASARILLAALRRTGLSERKKIRIAELGAGDSHFAERVRASFDCAEYHALDANQEMLQRLARRCGFVRPIVCDLRNGAPKLDADLVYSVGLIEHFDQEGTERVVRAHFECAAPNALIAIQFPTPTASYRILRGCAEALGLWRFPDERPLPVREAMDAGERQGGVLLERRSIPIGLTQTLLIFRKDGSNTPQDECGTTAARD